MGRYDETGSRWLLPQFMRADEFDDGVADIVDEFGADMSAKTRTYSVWDALDIMPEPAIDALAEELNILWYDKLASLESKRDIVRNCKHIQAKLGTKWATEEILKIYFSGATKITEWFAYERTRGDPNHFAIETEYTARTAAETIRFMTILNKVKRKSAILDKVYAVISTAASVEAGAWLQHIRAEDTEAARSESFQVVILQTVWRGKTHLQELRVEETEARRTTP